MGPTEQHSTEGREYDTLSGCLFGCVKNFLLVGPVNFSLKRAQIKLIESPFLPAVFPSLGRVSQA